MSVYRCDFQEALERGVAFAGGAARAPESTPHVPEVPGLAPEIYDAAARHLLALGELRESGAVETYLARRGLLEEARADGWASLPPWGVLRREFDEEVLVGLGLAHRRKDGRLGQTWGDNRLVIPWRDDEGWVCTIQRRLIRAPRNEDEKRRKYVAGRGRGFAAPYGLDRLGSNGDLTEVAYTNRAAAARGRSGENRAVLYGASGQTEQNAGETMLPPRAPDPAVLWVEGAVDALAARLLARRHGLDVTPLGVPGGGGWITAWRRYAAGRRVLYGLDADPSKAAWERPGDLFAAEIALDCAGLGEGEHRRRKLALGELVAAYRQIRHDEERGAITDALADAARAALGPLRCVLCGVEAAWLCEGCGRRRPRGVAKDWGEAWERAISARRATPSSLDPRRSRA